MKKGFAYRFAIILVVYIFAGATVLGSMAAAGALPTWELWTILGVFLGAFILTIIINELWIARQKKVTNGQHH
jgi:ABC-type multidrug transport system permease subunit